MSVNAPMELIGLEPFVFLVRKEEYLITQQDPANVHLILNGMVLLVLKLKDV